MVIISVPAPFVTVSKAARKHQVMLAAAVLTGWPKKDEDREPSANTEDTEELGKAANQRVDRSSLREFVSMRGSRVQLRFQCDATPWRGDRGR